MDKDKIYCVYSKISTVLMEERGPDLIQTVIVIPQALWPQVICRDCKKNKTKTVTEERECSLSGLWLGLYWGLDLKSEMPFKVNAILF